MSNNNNQYTLPVNIRSEIISNAQEYTKDYIYNNDWVDTAHCSYIEGATAYAIKLHHVQQENESLTNQLKKQNEVQVENMKLLRQENEKLRVDLNEAKKLLDEVFRKHESGLLPDRFIYEKIKKFLYGE